MAETHRRVGTHHVEVAAPFDVPQPYAFAAVKHDRQRRVVAGAEVTLLFAQPVAPRSQRSAGDFGHPVPAATVGVEVGPVLGDLHRDEVAAGPEREQDVGQRLGVDAFGSRAGHGRHGQRVEGIDVETEAEAGLAATAAHDRQRIAEHGGQAAFADFVHVEDAYAELSQTFVFFRFPGAGADDAHPCRIESWAGDADQAAVTLAQQGRQWHAVDIARMGGLGRVAVEVGIDPDQAGRTVGAPADTAPGSCGNGVIAAEDQRERVRVEYGQAVSQASRECRAGFQSGCHVLRALHVGRRLGGAHGIRPFGMDASVREALAQTIAAQVLRCRGRAGMRRAERGCRADDGEPGVGAGRQVGCIRHEAPPIPPIGGCLCDVTTLEGAGAESFAANLSGWRPSRRSAAENPVCLQRNQGRGKHADGRQQPPLPALLAGELLHARLLCSLLLAAFGKRVVYQSG